MLPSTALIIHAVVVGARTYHGGQRHVKRYPVIAIVEEKGAGVNTAIGTVTKHASNPLLTRANPYDIGDNGYANVIHDPTEPLGAWRIWYQGGDPHWYRALCHANSSDGLSWVKPDLGMIRFENDPDAADDSPMMQKYGKQNNVAMFGTGVGLFLDPNEENRSRRFKAVRFGLTVGELLTSPDGLHWTVEQVLRYPRPQKYDTHNNIIWDERNGTYLLTTRVNIGSPGGRHVAIARSTPGEFHWDAEKGVQLALQPNSLNADPPRPIALRPFGDSNAESELEVYSQIPFIWPGMETQVYLGMASVINKTDDTVHCRLSWSRDALHWEWVAPGGIAGRDFIPFGETGAFDSHICFAAAHPVTMPGLGVRLYYSGGNGPHGGSRNTSLGLATLDPDRYAGLSGTGSVTTTAVNCSGNALTITADVLVGGSIIVDIVDDAGLVHGFAFTITRTVTDYQLYDKNLAGLVGKDVKFSIELHHAVIYTVGFTQVAEELELETNVVTQVLKDHRGETRSATITEKDVHSHQTHKFVGRQVSSSLLHFS